MAMNFATIFTNSHSIQKGAVGFIPCLVRLLIVNLHETL